MKSRYYVIGAAALTLVFCAANSQFTPLVLANDLPPTPTCVVTDPACDWLNGSGRAGHIGEGSIRRDSTLRWDSEPTPTPTPPPCHQDDPDCIWPEGGGGGGHIGEG